MKFRSLLVILILFSFPLLAGGGEGKKPKNIIVIIGDGMGMNQVTSEVIFNPKTPFKRFENIGMSVTCAADNLITDSAAGATAISTGHKTYNGAIGVDTLKKPLTTIFEIAVAKGKKAGLIATSNITDATPASFFAHVDSRKKQNDIALQFSGKPIDVLIGGGRKFFLPKDFEGGAREDSLNLVNTYQENGYFYSSVFPADGYKKNQKLCFLLETESLKKAGERPYTLNDLAKTGLNQIKDAKNGFVLLIEGSQIDYAGHVNDSSYLTRELKEFSDMLHTIIDFVEKDGNTLLVVTADHETGGMSLISSADKTSPLSMAFTTKGHSAGIVGVFAKGPQSDKFRGMYENNEIGQKLMKIVTGW